MASWGTVKNQHMPNSKGFDENDLVMGVMLSQKHDLIQNCDLPPPMKVFPGSDIKTVVPRSMKRKINTFSLMGNQEDIDDDDDDDDDGKLGLLKALRLSQTRAREAEARCAAISKERELLALGFMENSMQAFAYRQLVRLLEFQVSKLQQQQKKQEMCCDCGTVREDEEAMDDGNGTAGFTWIMAVAFCLGIAGFGFALGCKYKCF